MDRCEIQEETSGGTPGGCFDLDDADQLLLRENLVGTKAQEHPDACKDNSPGRNP